MQINRSFGLALFALSLVASGCANTPDESSSAWSAESAFDLFMSEGMTCSCMQVLRDLPEIEADRFRDMVWSSMSSEELTEVIEARDRGCTPIETMFSSDVGVTSAEITGTYYVEPIEETSGSGGVQPVYIYQDNSGLGCMCGGDCNDYIAEFDQVSGAYSNRSSLRIRGTNIWANCYLANPTMARVYSDNDIRACIGWWSVFFCGGGGYIPPQTSEIRVWL